MANTAATTPPPATRRPWVCTASAQDARPSSGLRLAARDPDRRVWSRRSFRYAFDPDHDIPAGQPARSEQVRAAVRRALNTWESAGVGLLFREVDMDEEPDVVIRWVTTVHSFPDGDHDPLTGTEAAHANFPLPLRNSERPRYFCFDHEGHQWDDVPDADGDGRADITTSDSEDLESVALHEFGHFLGIDHVPDPLAAMYFQTNGQWRLRPDDLEALKDLYPPQGRLRVNAIWAEGTFRRQALAWPPDDGTVFPGVPAADLEEAIERAQEEGWQPTRINAYEVPEGRFYNVVMDQTGGDRPWAANRDEDEFFEIHEGHLADGFRLMSIDTFRDGQRWNGVWISDDQQSQLMRIEGDGDVARDAIESMPGWRPAGITAYVHSNGVQHWEVVMWRNPVRFRVRLGLTRDEMRPVFDEMVADGYAPFDIGTFVLPGGGGERWHAIYVPAGARTSNFRARGKYDAANEITRYEAREDFDAFNLNAFVRPAPLATTQVTAHEVAHPAPAPGASVVTTGVAVDDRRVYATRFVQNPPTTAANEPNGTVVILDRQTMAEIEVTAVGHRPRAVAVNPDTGRVYVANRGQRSFSVSVVDGDTLDVVATIPVGQGPGSIAVNPATNRVYVTNWAQGCVHVIDGATDELLAPIPLGGRGPLGITLDAERNQLYVTIMNRSFAPFRNGLVRITDHGRGAQVEPFVSLPPLDAQSQDAAVDADRDRVYVANLGGGPEPPSIFVLHRASLDVLAKVPVPGPVRAIAVNPDAGEVYGAGDRGTMVLDASTNTFVRVLDQRIAWGIAAAGGTARQLFLAEHTGSITRLSG